MTHCVFEYLYRDAGNFKAWGELLLEGRLEDADLSLLHSRFENGEHFIAEQIGVPTLYETLWQQCESVPSEEMDHVWHEFGSIREATVEDLTRLKRWGLAKNLRANIARVDAWKLQLSRNWDL